MKRVRVAIIKCLLGAATLGLTGCIGFPATGRLAKHLKKGYTPTREFQKVRQPLDGHCFGKVPRKGTADVVYQFDTPFRDESPDNCLEVLVSETEVEGHARVIAYAATRRTGNSEPAVLWFWDLGEMPPSNAVKGAEIPRIDLVWLGESSHQFRLTVPGRPEVVAKGPQVGIQVPWVKRSRVAQAGLYALMLPAVVFDVTVNAVIIGFIVLGAM